MLLEKRRILPQRILRQIRIEMHQSQRRKTDQSGEARCRRVVVAVGGICTRTMCVRARRCQRSSTESARSPPQRLYIPGQGVRWSRTIISLLWYGVYDSFRFIPLPGSPKCRASLWGTFKLFWQLRVLELARVAVIDQLGLLCALIGASRSAFDAESTAAMFCISVIILSNNIR